MKIGFNSNVLRRCGASLSETISFLKKIGCNSFELSFIDSSLLFDFELTEDLRNMLNSFDYLSIHAPFDPAEGELYGEDYFMEKIVSKIKDISSELKIDGVVFHPNYVKNFDILANSGLPVLLENMDARKDSFRYLKSIKKIKEAYKFKFVLDIEHAFENDISMNLTDDMIELMGERIGEIHLSGAVSDAPLELEGHNHCMLGKSKHRKKLLGVLEKLRGIPIILETGARKGEEKLLLDELNYVREHLDED